MVMGLEIDLDRDGRSGLTEFPWVLVWWFVLDIGSGYWIWIWMDIDYVMVVYGLLMYALMHMMGVIVI